MPTGAEFFDESSDQSRVKARIVQKYFWAWARIMMGAKRSDRRIAYIDLFAGPGRYQDGTVSTPLLILETAIGDAKLRQNLVTIFNDRDLDSSQALAAAISAIPGIKTLRHAPDIRNQEVGDQIVARFESMHLVPTLIFVDPWGYKGLSLRLVNSVVKDWGCEAVFFFNYNRINAGLGNPAVEEHMNALFGERAPALREKLEGLAPGDRELTIVEELTGALQDLGGRYVLPFVFKNEAGTRTSHHLFFVSKNVLGYRIMKDVMARESTTVEQGVASFGYNPADRRFPVLFELNRPLDELADMLLAGFAGRSLRVSDVFETHHVGRRFVLENYKAAIRSLEAAGHVACTPPAATRRKLKGQVTMADNVLVQFPPAP